MLATTPAVPMDLPCSGWECFYRVQDMNYTTRPDPQEYNPENQKDKSCKLVTMVTETNYNTNKNTQDEEEQFPPTWSFELFDRNTYCWLKKEL